MADNPSGYLPSSTGIAALRWLVTLAQRDQAPGPNGGITETFPVLAKVRADVQPTYPTTYYNSAQIDTPITHLVRVRWADYVEGTHVVVRHTKRPSDGTYRCEMLRVRRVKEIGGRKRFTELEVELEKAMTTQTDDDSEWQALFAEAGGSLH
jgi:head-tail adaptor